MAAAQGLLDEMEAYGVIPEHKPKLLFGSSEAVNLVNRALIKPKQVVMYFGDHSTGMFKEVMSILPAAQRKRSSITRLRVQLNNNSEIIFNPCSGRMYEKPAGMHPDYVMVDRHNHTAAELSLLKRWCPIVELTPGTPLAEWKRQVIAYTRATI